MGIRHCPFSGLKYSRAKRAPDSISKVSRQQTWRARGPEAVSWTEYSRVAQCRYCTFVSVCKQVGIEIKDFPTLNAPNKVVVEATIAKNAYAGCAGQWGSADSYGQHQDVLRLFPRNGLAHWQRQESMVSWKGRSRLRRCYPERMSYAHMQTMDRYNHPDGDIMSLLQAIELVEGILNKIRVTDVKLLPWNSDAVSALERAGLQSRTVMQIWQNITQISETMANSGLPMGKERLLSDKYYGTLMAHAFWEGFHMQVMMRGNTGRYASPVHEWTTGRTTLAYSPLFLLPLKKGIIDGSPILQWLMPIPVEWLIERDWRIQTHWGGQ